MHALTQEMDRRWGRMFQQLVDGLDLPPTQRLRGEGLMEAAVLLDIHSPEQIDDAMEAVYKRIVGHGFAAEFGAEWRRLFPFPQIPAMARRAPVYPSTPE
ncbi:MAG: hypothetical protein AAGA91_09485 [Pseudomonadota bacterium]